MLVDCLYRVTPFGEIIRSEYDTETGVITGVPTSLFNVQLDSTKWSYDNYKDAGKTYPVGLMEQFMLKHIRCSCCIEIDNLGFYAFCDEFIGLIVGYEEEYIPSMSLEEVPFQGHWMDIGYRPTKVYQHSMEPLLYRLSVNTETKECVTQEGIYKLDYPLDKIGKLNATAKGYSAMMRNEMFGVIYDLDGNPILLMIRNGKLQKA